MNLNNISQIRYMGDDITLAKLNGDILYKRGDTPVEPIEKEYAIEYTITARNSTDTLSASYNSSCYYYLPLLYTGTSSNGSVTKYDKILITKTDGTTTDDITTKAKEISLIKLWYTKDTYRISFYGYSESNPCYIKEILNGNRMNTDNITSMRTLFYYCTKLTKVDVSNWNTSNVTDMGWLTFKCYSLTSLDVSNFDTSKVTNMKSMFHTCSSLTSLDLSNFNTGKVTDMSFMFQKCSKLTSLDLSNWDMAKVTSTTSMFGDSLISSLNYIDLSESDDSTINKVITRLYTRTKATYGKMLVPETTSQTVINAIAAKYWKPIGPIFNGTFEIATELEEIVGLGKSSAIICGNWSPWYAIEEDIEFISSDESIAYINDKDEVVSVSYGTVNLYGRSKTNSQLSSNIYSITISETDSYPYIIKLKTDASYVNINDININKNDMEYNSLTDVYSYDVGSPITKIECSDSDVSYIKFIKIDTSNVTNMSSMFTDCYKLTSLDVSNFNTSNVTDMSLMFNQCNKLTSLDVSNFDTSNVTDMQNMFQSCYKLTSLDLSNFDTSNVTNMVGMFNFCSKLTSLDISNFDTSSVTDMSYMFNNCTSLTSLDISNFDTSSVTDMSYMFNNCTSLTSLDVSSFNTSNVTDMSNMFNNCPSLTSLDLSSFNTSNLTDMNGMFSNCKSLTSLDLSNFDTSNVKNRVQMFYNVPLDIDFHYNGNNYENWTLTEKDCRYDGIFQWNLPTDLQYSDDYYVDYSVCRIPEPLDYFHIRKLGIPAVCIDGRQTYNFQKIEITKNDGSKTDDTSTPCDLISSVRVYYPESCEKVTFEGLLNPIHVSSNTSEVYCNFFVGIVNIRTYNFTDMSYMFFNCTKLTSLDLSNFNTSKVTNMSSMFNNCKSLTSLDLSSFNTSNVTNMYQMFSYCTSLTSLDLSNFNTSKVTDMSYMFYNCTSLTSLDLSNFNTSKVTAMYSMFHTCTSLTSLDLSSFDTSNVYDMSYMFINCKASIYGGYKFATKGLCNSMFEYFSGSIYDIGYGEVSDASYMFANSNIDDYTFSNTFYYNVDFSNCSNMSYMFYNCTNLNYFYFNDSSYHKTYGLNDTSYMFAGCTNLSELYINYMYTSNVWSYDGMFNDVYGNIYVGSDFTLTESDTGYSGTFIWY